MTSKDITLYYFGINGKAILPRFILNQAKVEFTNKTYTFEDWGKESVNHEYNQLPQLTIGGKVFSQSLAIAQYLAKKYNPELLGKTDDEQYEVHNFLLSVEDLGGSIFPIYKNQDPSKKQELLNIAIEELKRFVVVWEKKYTASGAGKYYIGDYLTLVDVTLDYFLQLFTVVIPDLEKTFTELAPNLNKIILANRETGAIKEFRESQYFNQKTV